MTVLEQASWELSLRRPSGNVVLHGEFDMTTTPAMRAEYARAAALFDAPVVFDLRDVGFADSSLVHALVDAGEGRRSRGHSIAVRVAPSSEVARLLVLTGVADRLDVRESSLSG